MQNNLKPPIKGEWINIQNYTSTGMFICSKCNIVWSSDNCTFYNKEKCPNNKCYELCQSKYIWYSNNNLSKDIIKNSVLNLFADDQTNGIWIKPNKYQSFGYFNCTKCKKKWFSAYANSKYRQGCTKCHLMNYPKYMWINHDYNYNDNDNHHKEHLSNLCEGCKNNDCKFKIVK